MGLFSKLEGATAPTEAAICLRCCEVIPVTTTWSILVSSSSIAIERLATLLFTRYSLPVYPINEKVSTSPCLALIEKNPSASVVVPRTVPCTSTVTPTSGVGGSFVSTTTPRISNNSSAGRAAKAGGGKINARPADRQARQNSPSREPKAFDRFVTGLSSSMIHSFKFVYIYRR